MDKKTVDDILFDVQEELGKKWKEEFPDGKLPDRIGYLLSGLRREYHQLLDRAKGR